VFTVDRRHRGFAYCFSAYQVVAVQGATLIVPLAAEGDKILPETATPSSLENQNSPLVTGTGAENVMGVEVPHARLASASF
jgi:hypothetical protein